jgi:hypothetical protein
MREKIVVLFGQIDVLAGFNFGYNTTVESMQMGAANNRTE